MQCQGHDIITTSPHTVIGGHVYSCPGVSLNANHGAEIILNMIV